MQLHDNTGYCWFLIVYHFYGETYNYTYILTSIDCTINSALLVKKT